MRIHYERLIYALLDGRLTGRRLRQLEEHLGICPQCRLFKERVELLRRELKEIGKSLPPDIDWVGLGNRIEMQLKQQASAATPPRALAFFGKLSLVSAALLLVFAIYVIVGKQRQDGGRKSSDRLTTKVEKMPAGARGEPDAIVPAAVTFTSPNVLLAAPGLGARPMSIDSPISEGSRVETRKDVSCGIQVGRLAGIRVEADSIVDFRNFKGGQIAIYLGRGTVSVDYLAGTGSTGMLVVTEDATITVRGTLFSVCKQSEHTNVVVGRGTVEVKPARGKAGGVAVRHSEGVRVSSEGFIANLEPATVAAEKERLESVLFNIYREEIPEEFLTVDIKDSEEFAFLAIGGKREGSNRIDVRLPSGEGKVTLIMKDGRGHCGQEGRGYLRPVYPNCCGAADLSQTHPSRRKEGQSRGESRVFPSPGIRLYRSFHCQNENPQGEGEDARLL